MLGYLLYESVEVAYTVLKLTYNAGSGIYYWYYDIENKSLEEIKIEKLEKEESEKDFIIKNLEDRLERLEDKVNN